MSNLIDKAEKLTNEIMKIILKKTEAEHSDPPFDETGCAGCAAMALKTLEAEEGTGK